MQIAIRTPFITLEALLKFSGLATTGGQAKELILGGLVRVEGAVVRERGKKIRPGMVVRLVDGGEPLEVVSEV